MNFCLCLERKLFPPKRTHGLQILFQGLVPTLTLHGVNHSCFEDLYFIAAIDSIDIFSYL